MNPRLRLATGLCLAVYCASFFFYAASPSGEYFGGMVGYEAAGKLLVSPVKDPPDTLHELFQLIVVWPANLLIVAAFIRLLTGRIAATPYLAAYGFAGQLYWIVAEIHPSNVGLGYWLWLFSGLLLFLIAILAQASRPPDATNPS